MLTTRALSYASLATVILLGGSSCKMIEDVKEIGAKVEARFPGDGPKIGLENGRKLVVTFEDPDKQLAEFAEDKRISAAAQVVAGILPEAGKIDSVKIVAVKYGVGMGGARAAVEESESFSVSDLKQTKSQ